MQANSGGPDQTPQNVVSDLDAVASDLGVHYLPMSHKKDSIYGLKNAIILLIS